MDHVVNCRNDCFQPRPVFGFQIYDAEGTLQHFLDGNDPSKSSWMRYIRCARHCGEQNMMVVQYR